MSGVRISLAASNLIYITKNGAPLTPNADETLWFKETNLAGSYEFIVMTKAKVKYRAVLEWIPTP
ncbi:hypothetical protein J2Z32_003741 [Paenibacillus turicensis]|uniref:Uncharacterized protein n=1 Tax=Paenibacillus turicensis TaxID=160487 RepID=A0ABS4FWW7_9BACL|nr:hypothetical protein [Paenibacillus turicensis]MBP1907076.1 hypothetical protein [Paenibacillus turicensis]